MRRSSAYSLVELLIVVAVLAAMAFVAVPRLPFAMARQKQAEAAAWQTVSMLRRTRSLAILNAATHPDGFALQISIASGVTTLEIVDVSASSVVDTQTLDSAVSCTGTSRFEFDPFGTLTSAGTSLSLSAAGATYQITIVPATGMVRCEESS